MSVPTISLNDETTIPQLGFGVFQVPPPKTAETVTAAFEVGYRKIDTAEMYGNEKGVGEAIAASGTMTGFVAEGRARSIGVSNFQPAHLDRIVEETGVVPAVNQVEVHPFFGNEEVRAANARHGVATEAWSPIAKGKVLDSGLITEISTRLGRTPAQVTLRWHVERGDIVFPKSMSPARMKENFEIFDFELDADDVRAISSLDQGVAGRIGPHPDRFDWIPS